MKTAIIISYFDERPIRNLTHLLRQLDLIGLPKLVVINTNGKGEANLGIPLSGVEHIYRENTGMNIGAWNEGAMRAKGFENLIFMQDECFIKDTGFHRIYDSLLNDSRIGLVGESINKKWCAPWDSMRNSPLNYLIPEVRASRVDFYLRKLETWGINPGFSGAHMRSLVFGMRRELFIEIGGFPVGKNKEECIAAEIGISREIASRGLSIAQSDTRSFRYIGHREWAMDHESKVFGANEMGVTWQ